MELRSFNGDLWASKEVQHCACAFGCKRVESMWSFRVDSIKMGQPNHSLQRKSSAMKEFMQVRLKPLVAPRQKWTKLNKFQCISLQIGHVSAKYQKQIKYFAILCSFFLIHALHLELHHYLIWFKNDWEIWYNQYNQ